VQSLKKNADKLDKEIMRQVDTIYKIWGSRRFFLGTYVS
jgi:hypothetical protein